MVTELIPRNGNIFGSQKWEPIWYHKTVTDLAPTDGNRTWYPKMGTDLVHQNGNRFGNHKWELNWCPQTVFLDQHHTDLMCANGNRYRSQAYCLCANTLIRVVSKSGRRCGFKGSRSFVSKGNRQIDTECLGRRCIVDNIYVIPEDDTDVDPEKQLSLAATAGAFWVFKIYI